MADQQPPPDQPGPHVPDEQLLAALGDDFLKYVLASDLDGLTSPEVRQALDARQTEAFDQTMYLARLFAVQRPANASNDDSQPPPELAYLPLSWAFARFFQHTEEDQTVAGLLRAHAGGQARHLPDREEDLLRYAMHWLARDLWPCLLLPQDPRFGSRFFMSGMGANSFGHPAQALLKEAVGQTREPLRQLYPDLSGDLPDSVGLMSSAGRGGTVQLGLLGDTLITSAAYRCQGPLTEPGLFRHLDDAIDQARQLARNRVPEVPATVGLAG